MTTRKNLKRLVRARAAKTGESYATALRHVRDQPSEEHTMPDTPTKPLVLCSFCAKTQAQVKKLIAGPGGIYICEECIGLCSDIIETDAADAAEAATGSTEEPPDRRALMLQVLPSVAKQSDMANESLTSLVRRLRGLDAGWDEIATALGVTETEARERFDT